MPLRSDSSLEPVQGPHLHSCLPCSLPAHGEVVTLGNAWPALLPCLPPPSSLSPDPLHSIRLFVENPGEGIWHRRSFQIIAPRCKAVPRPRVHWLEETKYLTMAPGPICQQLQRNVQPARNRLLVSSVCAIIPLENRPRLVGRLITLDPFRLGGKMVSSWNCTEEVSCSEGTHLLRRLFCLFVENVNEKHWPKE